MIIYDNQKGVYLVVVYSRLSIPTPEINQSSWGEPGKWFSPVGLSVRLVQV